MGLPRDFIVTCPLESDRSQPTRPSRWDSSLRKRKMEGWAEPPSGSSSVGRPHPGPQAGVGHMTHGGSVLEVNVCRGSESNKDGPLDCPGLKTGSTTNPSVPQFPPL